MARKRGGYEGIPECYARILVSSAILLEGYQGMKIHYLPLCRKNGSRTLPISRFSSRFAKGFHHGSGMVPSSVFTQLSSLTLLDDEISSDNANNALPAANRSS